MNKNILINLVRTSTFAILRDIMYPNIMKEVSYEDLLKEKNIVHRTLEE